MSEQQQQHPVVFCIQSKIDNQKFTVDKKVIESSALLKNICEITDITEPIMVNCSGHSLNMYINLINNYDSLEEDAHDKEFEKNLFDTFTSKEKKKLIQLIQDLCILDSDFFLDSVADYILEILGDCGKMNWNDIQIYLGLENDFSQRQRNFINKDEKLEYFLSINTRTFKFPFANKSLYSLKTDFSTPMNSLIARIVRRSNAKISYLLSIINKTLKNEVDRHPFKLTEFNGRTTLWNLHIYSRKIKICFWFNLTFKDFDDKYFNALKTRKIITEELSLYFDNEKNIKHPYFECNSAEFPISKEVVVSFSKTFKSIFQFDAEKYYCSSIYYKLMSVEEDKIDFEEIYNQLIAKDLSKEIELDTVDKFDFFSYHCVIRFHKKANASKFCMTEIYHRGNPNPKFKEFVMNYMEEDGIIDSQYAISGIPMQKSEKRGHYKYPVSTFIKYLEYI